MFDKSFLCLKFPTIHVHDACSLMQSNVYKGLFAFILTPSPLFVSFHSFLRVSKYFAACGSASHPPASAPAEGAANLFWDPWQHLCHN